MDRAHFKNMAEKARRLAARIADDQMSKELLRAAQEYEAKVAAPDQPAQQQQQQQQIQPEKNDKEYPTPPFELGAGTVSAKLLSRR